MGFGCVFPLIPVLHARGSGQVGANSLSDCMDWTCASLWPPLWQHTVARDAQHMARRQPGPSGWSERGEGMRWSKVIGGDEEKSKTERSWRRKQAHGNKDGGSEGQDEKGGFQKSKHATVSVSRNWRSFITVSRVATCCFNGKRQTKRNCRGIRDVFHSGAFISLCSASWCTPLSVPLLLLYVRLVIKGNIGYLSKVQRSARIQTAHAAALWLPSMKLWLWRIQCFYNSVPETRESFFKQSTKPGCLKVQCVELGDVWWWSCIMQLNTPHLKLPFHTWQRTCGSCSCHKNWTHSWCKVFKYKGPTLG